MSLAILFHFLCAQHVSDINISIIRSLRLCCWIITSVVLISVRCVLDIWCGWVWVVSVLQPEQNDRCGNSTALSQAADDGYINVRNMLSTAHKQWNKIASDIKLVFYSSTITMTHGPINIRFFNRILYPGYNLNSRYRTCSYTVKKMLLQPQCGTTPSSAEPLVRGSTEGFWHTNA